tara:strand:+ start:358 stop:516 length:159 start_codon:yes stop_codon:yes gene_type:complete
MVDANNLVTGEEILNDSEICNKHFHEEWQALYQSGIVPQKPPRFKKEDYLED